MTGKTNENLEITEHDNLVKILEKKQEQYDELRNYNIYLNKKMSETILEKQNVMNFKILQLSVRLFSFFLGRRTRKCELFT